MQLIFSKLPLYIEWRNEKMNENDKEKLVWIYKSFWMKIINIHQDHTNDKNNAGYVNAGIFPQ